VALPAALGAPHGAPVAGDWLFVDPTQTVGGLGWLHPAVAGQHALVVGPGGGELVEIPVHPAAERETLKLDLALGDGEAAGTARLEVNGAFGAALDYQKRTAPAATVLAGGERLLTAMLPGGDFDAIVVGSSTATTPQATIEAQVRLPALATGAGDELSFLLPGSAVTPRPSLLEGRALPVVLTPGIVESEWGIALPAEGCTLDGAAAAIESAVGSFRQDAEINGKLLTVRRRTELRERMVATEGFPELERLALVEHRTLKRRLRLSCP
jgi:hypothetical protein